MNTKLRKTITKILLSSISLAVHAQDIKPLTIGDKVPLLNGLKTFGYNSEHIDISDFKGKAILIDFWTTHCAGCITLFPYLEKLQHLYSKDLQIISVSPENFQTVKVFANRVKRVKNIDVESVIEDVQLHEMFPHVTEPHLVWIGKDRVVKAITRPEEVTDVNIQSLVHSDKINLPIKNDGLSLRESGAINSVINGGSSNILSESVAEMHDIGKIAKELGNDSTVMSFSLLSEYSKRNGASGWTSYAGPNTLYKVGCGIDDLFGLANFYDLKTHKANIMRFYGPIQGIKIKVITKDSIRFFGKSTLEYKNASTRSLQLAAYFKWADEVGHRYSYIIKVPSLGVAPNKPNTSYSLEDKDWQKWQKWINKKDSLLSEAMRQDMARCFPWIKAEVSKDTATVYILKSIIPGDFSGIESKEKGESKVERTPYYLVAKNVEMDRFVKELWFNFQMQTPRVEDQVSLDANYRKRIIMVNADIETDMTDFNKVNEALKKYGLYLEKQKRNEDILILTDTRSQAEIQQYYADLAKQIASQNSNPQPQ